MKIFRIIGDPGYELVQPVSQIDYDVLNALGMTGRSEGWKPIRMQVLVADKKGRARKHSDAPWLGCDPLILRPNAVDAMRELLLEESEFLPVSCVSADLVIMNPTHRIGGLDEERSEVKRLQPSGRIFEISKYEFIPDQVRGRHLFKIDSLLASPTFVTDAFVSQWKIADLRGLEFVPVWGD